jgi:hypothetical protein
MAVDIQAPQYPAPITPSFASFSARQRMEIEDALAAEQAQKERQLAVGRAGLKFGYEYDKMLRGYMEAKFANPELTYWDYVRKPAVGGAFRAEGRKKIAEHIKAGGDIDELPGMTFSERHKAGLKGLFEKKAKEPKLPDVPTEYPAGHPRARAESALNVEKAIAESDALKKADVMPAANVPLEDLDASKLLSKSAEMKKATGSAVETIGKLIETPKPVAAVGPQTSIGEITQAKNLPHGTDVSKLDPTSAAGLETGAGEATKAGLKETLGKGAAGLGYGASVVSGAQRLAEGKTTEEKIGGGLQVAGGAAGLVAMTNFWNPVGWAAAIPAALSIGGGLMGGGSDPLARTPLGRYRRRVGIG